MIDRATVDLILDSADIVDVVSDFVTLKRRGVNYVGLCPFHNDRTPSFYVSKSKGICKCFSCGQGGSAVNFIMLHEQLSYQEALRYLANKYHIEIQEREQTDEEKAAQSAREAMLMLNEWACSFFEDQLHNTTAGQEIGLSYFNDRGFSKDIIKRFRLGYSPEDRSALYKAAVAKGFNRQLLFDTGLCIDDNRGGGYDRYRGRVIFPILNIAGKIVAFGGRTLRNDPAKYVNSPESIIYNKSNELYGLYQARREVSKQDKCFIVEGYADVISMHQSGFENVIATSGTALTDGHIHKIHRFTENITEMFDGDAAGIRAALKGIDKLLAQGMNIKVLLLPDDDDPDSFSRKHSASEIQDYIDNNEEDFIKFKSRILLKDTDRDPIKRSKAIEDVVKSIAVIPSEVTRAIYAKECSDMFGIGEDVVLRDIKKFILQLREEAAKQRERDRIRQERQSEGVAEPAGDVDVPPTPPVEMGQMPQATATATVKSPLYPQEEEMIKYVVKYGLCNICISYQDENNEPQTQLTTVVEYLSNEFNIDNINFTTPAFKLIFDTALTCVESFYTELETFSSNAREDAKAQYQNMVKDLDPIGYSSEQLQKEEEKLQASVNAEVSKKVNDFRTNYLERILCSHQNDEIRQTSSNLVSEPYTLSKIHTEFATITTEFDRLSTLVPQALLNWKNAIVSQQIKEVQLQIQRGESNIESLLAQLNDLYHTRSELSKFTGERVITPK